MRLAIDCGNTHVDLGLFRGKPGNLFKKWRFRSVLGRSAGEYGALFSAFLGSSSSQLQSVNLSCVQPELLDSIAEGCKRWLGFDSFLIRSSLIDAPPEAGGDRVANATGVMSFYKTPAVVVDFGTATAFDLISSKGLEGCVIAQGVDLFVKGHNSIAEHLPRVDVPQKPAEGCCRSTVAAMEEGLYAGYRGMVAGIILSLERQIKRDLTVISTGGAWEKVRGCMDGIFNEHAPYLTLKGIDVLACQAGSK